MFVLLVMARKLLLDVGLLHFCDFDGDVADEDLVVGGFEETIVQVDRYLLLFGLVAQSLRAEGRCLIIPLPRMMVPKFYRHCSTVMSSVSSYLSLSYSFFISC